MRTSINPPPPIFPAEGSTTANANAVATAASTALPPFWRISSPAREANSSSVATMPCAPRTASFGHDFSTSARGLYSAALCASAMGREMTDKKGRIAANKKTARRLIGSQVRLIFGKEFDGVWAGNDAGFGSARDQFLHENYPDLTAY